ncbi:efflux RND transporter periplasmic adaptor subunit [uncultured Sphingomonas sp.]|uniref:efflux RND transporter periplasmic adaptor subunit n=1 Tax=uncultured Sphingomonas sp. TaxID=158754 RepID=UPI002638BFA7|nr:efflux RND transporter periplasmic adaptor subunit [uncultured Sphingomonas sp.]
MKSGTIWPAIAICLLSACGSSGSPDDTAAGTTLVTAIAARQGSLPRVIEAYGQATPAANGVATLSVQQPGQVVAIPAVAGTRVAAGVPVVVFAVAPSARSTYLQAEGAVKAAESQRATTAQLVTQQLATRDQLVQAEKVVTDARVALAALAKEGAGAATLTLRAPFAGIVSTLPVAPGDRTQPGQALATIARTGAMIVTVGVDPARRADLRVGAPVTLARLDGGADVAGHVQRVDAMLNPRTRQIDVDIAYPAGAILPGEAMRVAIETGRAEGWLVPHRAVVVDSDGKANVFQIAGGKAKAVPVTVDVARPDNDLVSGKLDARAPLIVDGAYQLGDGDAVRAQRGR